MMMNKRICLFLMVCLAAGLALSPVQAKKRVKHPLKVLKARVSQDNSRSMAASARGNLTVWLQNISTVSVDQIKLEVELYNDRRRLVETLEKEIGEMDAGKKKVVTFKWDVIAERTVKPKIFVYYNGGRKELIKFEGDPPVW